MLKKIAFFEVEPWEKDYLRKKLKGFKLWFSAKKLQQEDEKNFHDADAISIFINSPVTKKEVAALPKLKFIATRSTGFDHIDLAQAKKKKITVSNVPYYGENTVAEHTMALLLALSRKIVPSAQQTQHGDFRTNSKLRGFDLKGRTLGIIGFGHIGQHVARMAQGFAMKVIAYDPFPNQKAAKELKVELVSLPTLLKTACVISLHAPLTKQTKHLINLKNYQKLKKCAILINTARGALVQTKALVKALDEDYLAGVGLDVLENEDTIKEERQLLTNKFSHEQLFNVAENLILMNHPRVIITPHNAFNSDEALKRILDTTVDNLKGWFNKRLVNVVKL